MGKKYYPLMGPGGGDELSLVGEPVGDFLGQVPGLPELRDVLLLDGVHEGPFEPKDVG